MFNFFLQILSLRLAKYAIFVSKSSKIVRNVCFALQILQNLITFETRNEITKNISWKIANMTVFDCDFLHDDIEMVAQATIVATIVDGEEVYKA